MERVISILKIELNLLMTIIHAIVKEEIVIYCHVYNWIELFVSMYNDKTFENYFINELNERGEYILS